MDIANDVRARQAGRLTPGATGRFSRGHARAGRLDEVYRRYAEAQEAVQPLIVYLQDIHKALGADLTPAGIESMKGIVQNADVNAKNVHVALRALISELGDSGSRLSSLALQDPADTSP